MVTRAYVTSNIYTENGAQKCKINVPIFGESMEYSVLREKNAAGLTAIIACSPNERPNFKEGDAVIVAFEEYLADSPIILGWLFGSKDKKGTGDIYSTYPSSIFEDVTVGNNLTVPRHIQYIKEYSQFKQGGKTVRDYSNNKTTIDIDLSNLEGLKDVVQKQLDDLSAKDTKINERVNELSDTIDNLISTLMLAGLITNGYYSAANYEARAGSEPVNALPSSVEKSPSIIVPGN